MTLRTEIEIWNKYGAYLIGVTGISAKHKGVSFETFYNNLDGSTGCCIVTGKQIGRAHV